MITQDIEKLDIRLFEIFSNADFLNVRGLANEVPLFIQCYSPTQEDAMRRTVKDITQRLQSSGIAVKSIDLFDLVMEELTKAGIADDLLRDECTYSRSDMLETLENYSDPTIMSSRLIENIGKNTQLTLITGSGRVFPFLRTHALLEDLQPQMEYQYPIVFFFPGQYRHNPETGPQLRIFASDDLPDVTKLHISYYRAFNLDDYQLSGK